MKTPVKLFRKFVKTKNEREVAKIFQNASRINAIYETLKSKNLPAMTEEFRREIKNRTKSYDSSIADVREKIKISQNSTERADLKEQLKKLEKSRFEAEMKYLDEIMPTAFAMVKESCRRLKGRQIDVMGHKITWEMIPYDVQLIGAVVLHQGKISEMATGEGKTLVATMPVYLNAIPGHGVHLVTVNDYLAKRDSEWMGNIYTELGMTVGCVQSSMTFEDRKVQYSADITYGTNNEFGFDYLRDNIAIHPENRVQRGHYYCIVDEVDSVLIDEARTPLIISGLVETDKKDTIYQDLNPSVERIVRLQNNLLNQLITEGEKLFEEGDREKAGVKFLIAKNGNPKFKRLMKLQQKTGITSLIDDTEKKIMAEDGMSKSKKMPILLEELYYTLDEKGQTINISEKGRKAISPNDLEFFTLPDISILLKKVQTDSSLSLEEKVKQEDEIHRLYAEKSEKIHAVNQLLKAYSLFNKDDEYVVVDKKVMIVDEFTGRILAGRRYSDGLHQALQAKENVPIEAETQVIATITIQNYFRMYTKLSGMTGTAETESREFHKIYGLDVVVIPTNEPVRRIDYNDKIYKTRNEKFNAVIEEIQRIHGDGRPILVGTTSVETSETLSRMLKRVGINHEVLNAKQHQREAEIVAYAGQNGKVTIATNMAGRGTDIKLAQGIVKSPGGCLIHHKGLEKCTFSKSAKKCLENMPCGLHIIGTSRHESRRIDRQLRGRSGRQGDPGSSRFYLSLEDDLMRLFGSEKIARIMDRWGAKEGEVIEHPFVNKTVENAQKKVETFHFDIRQRVLKYDDVLNEQRNTIYEMRNIVLEGWDLKGFIRDKRNKVASYIVEQYLGEGFSTADYPGFRVETARHFGPVQVKPFTNETTADQVLQELIKSAEEIYQYLEKTVTEERMREIERFISLMIIDEFWRNHLYEMEALREGIGLRGYAQRDPLIEYTIEAQTLFNEMLFEIDREIVKRLYHPRIQPQERRSPKSIQTVKNDFSMNPQPNAQGKRPAQSRPQTVVYKFKKPGRNDTCPCGSGKKYKDCHGQGDGMPKNPTEEKLFLLYFEDPQEWEKKTGVKLKTKAK
ncbi:preprotein translocase subunit SecA [candidate division WOR-3 bacterium]|nr:preprotein translocase subunit SecA [candidate division WOR-3 bacterium]